MHNMNYSEFVARINERNRPSGGIRTIQTATLNARIDSHSLVLDIGCNTGFTSVNIALLTRAHVIGIDVNKTSLAQSREYARSMGVDEVEFIEASATQIPFSDNHFDMVWASNTTSFIDDKDKAMKEYMRVLKLGGTLAVVPIYYRKNPPAKIVGEISEALGTKVDVRTKKDWIDIVNKAADDCGFGLDLYFEEDFVYMDQASRIDQYIDMLLAQSCRNETSDKEHLGKIAHHFYNLFNENNYNYAGFSILLFQKRIAKDQMELFETERA